MDITSQQCNVIVYLSLVVLLAVAGCGNPQVQSGAFSSGKSLMSDSTFKAYWYQGEAELNRYDMEQIRYGEVRDGDAVMVFVTEDFLTEEQVKLESAAEGRETASVLKLNFIKEFVTGIYEYNMMSSIFTPVNYQDRPRSLKVASSSQEWCGTTYSQMNFNAVKNKYKITGHSYFEAEGDYQKSVEATLLEDEIWTKLRLNPDLLPEGNIQVIPSSFSIRTTHAEWGIQQATAKKSKWTGSSFPGDSLKSYSLRYNESGRMLNIIYEQSFPHQIAGWIQSKVTSEDDTLTAKSVRTHSIKSSYWQKNTNSDEKLRKKLGL
ncbi:hypothetical protein LX73_2254 [Fodinibius salinus]|uniref:Septum formation inhibitor Maf n=1 Tax=Fodinibius salinus TaxID=860790 RepID=A0A5D3YFU7_9BACT|nr:hypothetical protein [Fodinibius salinus]TYP92011.1 hypothetical protein LX73_2254 [Fodinibius salinus]